MRFIASAHAARIEAGVGFVLARKHFAILSAMIGGLLLLLPSAGFAQTARHAAMVIDANSGQVLHNEDGDELRYPASLTKMMTLYMLFEQIEAGRMSYSDRMLVSARAASAQPSKLGMKPGDTLRVSDAIKALVTKSANDAAITVAEAIAGSEVAFARLMTQRARDLGMSKTVFRNASGLPDANQVTTARDMITLGLRLQDDFPQHYRHFSTQQFSYAGKSFRNHNTMLSSFTGIDGIKTGYTRMSGFNLVTSVRRDGRHLVAAVFGGASAATRNGEMRVILLQALPHASTVKTRKPATTLVARARTKSAPLVVAEAETQAPAKTRSLKPKAAALEVAPAVAPPKPRIVAANVAPPAPAARQVAVAEPVRKQAAVQVFKVRQVSVLSPHESQPPAATPTTAVAEVAPPAQRPAPALMTASVAPPSFAAPAQPAAPATIAEVVSEKSSHSEAGFELRGLAGSGFAEQVTGARAELRGSVEPSPFSQPRQVRSMEDLIAESQPLEDAAPIVRTAAYTHAENEARALPPSTLQAQAANLRDNRAYADPRPAQRQAVAAASPPPPARVQHSGGFLIQIGAFENQGEANKRLAYASQVANGRLTGYAPVTVPVRKGEKQFYRARFGGFERDAASSTCAYLKGQNVDCLVLAAD